MKNILFSLVMITLIVSCNQFESSNKKTTKITKKVIYPSDNPAERLVYENRRYKDPNTGRVPSDMRRKELMFVQTLPVSEKFSKSNWSHRGPYNVGGRTRAIALDVQNENIILAGGTSGGMFRSIDGGQNWDMTTDPGQLHNVTCLAQDTRLGHEKRNFEVASETRQTRTYGVQYFFSPLNRNTSRTHHLHHRSALAGKRGD